MEYQWKQITPEGRVLGLELNQDEVYEDRGCETFNTPQEAEAFLNKWEVNKWIEGGLDLILVMVRW